MNVVQIPGSARSSLTVRLRPLTGQDELLLTAGDSSLVLPRLARLATDQDAQPIDINGLTVSQIDRLLAAVYDMLYGDRAVCQVDCRACSERFEFTLCLSKVIAAQDAERPGPADADGTWTLTDGRRVRAPRLADVAETADPASLLERLVVEGDASADPPAVAEFLERAAPVLSLDLDADCPGCGEKQVVRFDLARYLARRLSGERPFLIRETHLIASRYGWSHAEVMSLSRADRRAYAGLIEAEHSDTQRGRRAG